MLPQYETHRPCSTKLPDIQTGVNCWFMKKMFTVTDILQILWMIVISRVLATAGFCEHCIELSPAGSVELWSAGKESINLFIQNC
jgi:hypothetical protein